MSRNYFNSPNTLFGASLACMVFVACLVYLPSCVSAQQTPPVKAARASSSPFVQPDPIDFNDHEGWTQIFDGKTMNGWDGTPDVWHIEDGAIVGQSSDAHPSGTTNIIWRGGKPANFRLKCEMKLEGTGANGGIQYRSQNVPPKPRVIPPERLAQMTDVQKAAMKKMAEAGQKYAKWNIEGYQADFDYNNRYTGQLYEQGTSRGIIAWRGQVVATEAGRKPRLLATLATSDELQSLIKPGEWNQYEIIADGNTLVHIVNGHVMAVLVDTDPKFAQANGVIAFEIEGGGDVKISHRNVWLKQLP
jgi:Domain of Unknown Function (DUF1080)